MACFRQRRFSLGIEAIQGAVPLGTPNFLLRRAVNIKHPPEVEEGEEQKKEVRRRAPRVASSSGSN